MSITTINFKSVTLKGSYEIVKILRLRKDVGTGVGHSLLISEGILKLMLHDFGWMCGEFFILFCFVLHQASSKCLISYTVPSLGA